MTASVKNGVSATEFGLALVGVQQYILSFLSYLSAYLWGSWNGAYYNVDVHFGDYIHHGVYREEARSQVETERLSSQL